jgi:hypothetical protein
MFPIGAPVVDWPTIGKVVAAALVAGVVVSGAFSVAILGATRSMEMRRSRRSGEAGVYATIGLLGAAVCIGAIVGGIVIMTTK